MGNSDRDPSRMKAACLEQTGAFLQLETRAAQRGSEVRLRSFPHTLSHCKCLPQMETPAHQSHRNDGRRDSASLSVRHGGEQPFSESRSCPNASTAILCLAPQTGLVGNSVLIDSVHSASICLF